MSIAYLHLDGTDYELVHDVPSTDDASFASLQEKVAQVLQRPAAGEGAAPGVISIPPTDPVHFDVRREGANVDLLVAPGSVRVAAVFLTSRQRGRVVTDVTEPGISARGGRDRPWRA